MKKYNFLSIISIFLISLNICLAQKNDDDTEYTPNKSFPTEITTKIYNHYLANVSKIPNENTLKNMKIDKNMPNEVNVLLEEYDLMKIGEYLFYPAGGEYTPTKNWFVYDRFHSQKGALEFMFTYSEGSNSVPNFSYTRNYFQTPKKIEKKGEYYYYADAIPNKVSKQQSYHPLVYYKDFILIIDVTQSGKLGDINSPNRFRNIYLLVPKYF